MHICNEATHPRSARRRTSADTDPPSTAERGSVSRPAILDQVILAAFQRDVAYVLTSGEGYIRSASASSYGGGPSRPWRALSLPARGVGLTDQETSDWGPRWIEDDTPLPHINVG